MKFPALSVVWKRNWFVNENWLVRDWDLLSRFRMSMVWTGGQVPCLNLHGKLRLDLLVATGLLYPNLRGYWLVSFWEGRQRGEQSIEWLVVK
jgi:hypothetical protein